MAAGSRQGGDSGPQGTRVFTPDDVKGMRREQLSTGASTGAAIRGISEYVAGQRFTLTNGRLSVGRQYDNDIVLAVPSVSAVHARLSEQPDGGWKVLNVLSTNGTFVNDERISERILQHGDRVRFGEVEFVFEMGASRDGASSPSPGRAKAGDQRLIWTIAAAAAIAVGLLAWLVF